jgi:hypothetical protein
MPKYLLLKHYELAAYVSSEPGSGGEPLYEWIDVREVMSGAPSEN